MYIINEWGRLTMDFNFIESLVVKSKGNDEVAKETLACEFRPFILNLCKRTFIYGYDFQDLQNECYSALFNCIDKYKEGSNRFVAYGTNGIKNCMGSLIRKSLNNSSTDCSNSLSFSNNVDENLFCDSVDILQDMINDFDNESIKLAYSKLSDDDRELLDFIIIKGQSIRLFAYWKNLCYSTAVKKKHDTVARLRDLVS